jgi:hypothetical protein
MQKMNKHFYKKWKMAKEMKKHPNWGMEQQANLNETIDIWTYELCRDAAMHPIDKVHSFFTQPFMTSWHLYRTHGIIDIWDAISLWLQQGGMCIGYPFLYACKIRKPSDFSELTLLLETEDALSWPFAKGLTTFIVKRAWFLTLLYFFATVIYASIPPTRPAGGVSWLDYNLHREVKAFFHAGTAL